MGDKALIYKIISFTGSYHKQDSSDVWLFLEHCEVYCAICCSPFFQNQFRIATALILCHEKRLFRDDSITKQASLICRIIICQYGGARNKGPYGARLKPLIPDIGD